MKHFIFTYLFFICIFANVNAQIKTNPIISIGVTHAKTNVTTFDLTSISKEISDFTFTYAKSVASDPRKIANPPNFNVDNLKSQKELGGFRYPIAIGYQIRYLERKTNFSLVQASAKINTSRYGGVIPSMLGYELQASVTPGLFLFKHNNKSEFVETLIKLIHVGITYGQDNGAGEPFKYWDRSKTYLHGTLMINAPLNEKITISAGGSAGNRLPYFFINLNYIL
jgi:hypothetical protein